ncbi:MAG: DUF1156 domain-containing protein [Deltaproteobacteria bacterium]|nr:DUF1156 domain-containing protein [Deltaproteobacteria bacterium]
MTTSRTPRKKLIEVALPLDVINREAAREKSIRHGHPSTLHLWWARRPLAACRAVLFGQLVDDPSSWPERFPTEAQQDAERQRLFRIIEDLVKWESSNDEIVVNAARLEIARSIARGRKADGSGERQDERVLAEDVRPDMVDNYLAEVAPPVHDPFAGGGSIPLEAQRLGLRAIGSDLNPVAVLINKALIEIPPRFAGRPPVHPGQDRELIGRRWRGAQGLAEDVRYYGAWMREQAQKRIGDLYPPVQITKEMAKSRSDLEPYVGKKLTVIAWLWARTVTSPNPACKGAHVPLVSSFWLSKKPGRETWIEPVVDRRKNVWTFEVRAGKPKDPKAIEAGTKTGRGDFSCLLSGDPIPVEHIRSEGQQGRLGDRLMAVVVEGRRGRVYLGPTPQIERVARVAVPDRVPETDLPAQALGFRIQNYGLKKHKELFTPRQLTAITAFTDVLAEARLRALADARASGMEEGDALEAGGCGARAYADALAVYLAFVLDKTIDGSSVQCRWMVQRDSLFNTFAKQALPMTWDFAEVNVLADCTRSLSESTEWTAESIEGFTSLHVCAGTAMVRDARQPREGDKAVVSTDPPYFDNVPYADLSDYFYVWLRRSLQSVLPSLFGTVLVPKSAELVADPFRHGGRGGAEAFFLDGMGEAVGQIALTTHPAFPVTIYYAFKQTEDADTGGGSTGWETFLEATWRAGFSTVGTWPVRTEREGRSRDLGSNALASSIVLVCRKRDADAPSITRSDFRRLLRAELPQALKALQKGYIAPVDMAQASIGPGMAIYSRHAKVIEADGSTMGVRTALQLINQALDEYLTEREGEFDSDTRFAVTWFESRCFDSGPFGDAETLAKARNVSVEGVKDAGVLHSAAGKVRLLKRTELPDDWDPATDRRLTIWEATQHLIKRLEDRGEEAAADLMIALGGKVDAARDLAYRLYATCERKGWAEEARAYNGLVVSWPQIAKLAAQKRGTKPAQTALFES